MQNLTIHFEQPWLLLLFIPAIALTVYTYLRVTKKHRNTRNRIVSIVLHSIVMTLAILILAGLTFPYQVKNSENELMLVVDNSVTQFEAQKVDGSEDELYPTTYERNDFIRNIIDEAGYNNIKVGIVTFGFGQKYIVPLSFDTVNMYDTYIREVSDYENEEIDSTGTDIAAAVRYAASLFEYPETAKILIVTDAVETDESAVAAISEVAAARTKVDVVRFDANYEDDGIIITNIKRPDYAIRMNEEFDLSVELQSTASHESVTMELLDNGELDDAVGVKQFNIERGLNVVNFTLSLEEEGIHELNVRISIDDGDEYNNIYYSYIYLQVHDKVLIVEQREGDSAMLADLLREDYGDGVKIVNTNTTANQLPQSVDDMREYDQIILNNIANNDLSPTFVDNLHEYVQKYGGSLLTVGGSETMEDPTDAHAYDREDMLHSKLQSMLPVDAINYTPPVGVVFIIDVSGSMGEAIDWAKSGAVSCLDVLTDRDYVGIMTLSDTYGSALQLTSVTKRAEITEAIDAVGGTGSTYFVPAVRHACEALTAERRVDKRHIVVITDGGLFDIELAINEASKHPGITCSIIINSSSTEDDMTRITDAWGGSTHVVTGETSMMDELRNDLNAPEIKEYIAEDFKPAISNTFSPVLKGVEYDVGAGTLNFNMGGYYGTRKKNDPANPVDVILSGEYNVPLYAQWKYGIGNVGSFMSDLYGTWSKELLEDANGKKLLLNIIANLMPLTDIRPSSIDLKLNNNAANGVKYNYYNELSITCDLESGESLSGDIIYKDGGIERKISLDRLPDADEPLGDVYVIQNLDAETGYGSAKFVIKRGGAYTIRVNRLDRGGNVIDTAEVYRSFAYSSEFDTRAENDPAKLVADMVERGRGQEISLADPQSALTGFVVAFDRVFDPRLAFMIAAIILFLLDVAVRKFKFKWLHEIIRERRDRKERRRK